MMKMPGKSYRGLLTPMTSKERRIMQNLKRHIVKLADEIGERNIHRYDNLQMAADYITSILHSFKYEIYKQSYSINNKTCSNLVIEIPGIKKPAKIIVVGAHYDSILGSPGANDNGSGVAALLELARLFHDKQTNNTLRFIAFVNEEPPLFKSPDMGSVQYIKQVLVQKEQIAAMLSLETIGYYNDESKTQKYPFPYNFFYPNKGNFIAFVANLKSKKLLHQCIKTFREYCQFPSEGGAVPSWIPGVSWSDQWAFWQNNYPAVMITDTALFRYPYYHTAEDTSDKIDYRRLARVVTGLEYVIQDLISI